jgi:hypothetical protein
MYPRKTDAPFLGLGMTETCRELGPCRGPAKNGEQRNSIAAIKREQTVVESMTHCLRPHLAKTGGKSLMTLDSKLLKPITTITI